MGKFSRDPIFAEGQYAKILPLIFVDIAIDVPSNENVHLGFYFVDLIFVVCQSTTKTAKIGSLENIWLYGTILLS